MVEASKLHQATQPVIQIDIREFGTDFSLGNRAEDHRDTGQLPDLRDRLPNICTLQARGQSPVFNADAGSWRQRVSTRRVGVWRLSTRPPSEQGA
jgi:hypothetical protein